MSSHVVSVRTNMIVFVALLVLLFATIGAAYLPLGPLHLPLALSFAAAKLRRLTLQPDLYTLGVGIDPEQNIYH